MSSKPRTAMTSNDRKQIGAAHGVHESNGPWRLPRTNIVEPSNGRTQGAGNALNPFGRIGTQNTKLGQSKARHTTSGAGVSIKGNMKARSGTFSDDRDPKRPKQDLAGRRIPLAPEVHAYIDLADTSGDEINIRDQPMTPPNLRVQRHDNSKVPIAPDELGALQDLISNDEESDAISKFSSPVFKPRISEQIVPPGYVQSMKIQFEPKNDAPNVPRVDLAAQLRQRSARSKLRAPDSNHFIGKRKSRNGEEPLPLIGFATHDHREDRGCYQLYWSPTGRDFTVRDKDSMLLQVDLTTIKIFELVDVSATSQKLKIPCIMIKLGELHLVFDGAHDDWSLSKYCDFRDFISKKTNLKPSTMNPGAASSLWEHDRHVLRGVAEALPNSRKRSTSRNPTPPEDRPGENTGQTRRMNQAPPVNSSTNHQLPSFNNDRTTTMTAVSRQKSSASDQVDQATLRRSTRQTSATKTSIDPDEVILVYPYGVPGAVNITNADVARLEPGEFLNDTLIEFGLKLWLSRLQETNPTLAEQVHVFSSFFYKKFNRKNVEEGYNSVRKWTSKFDLFKKKYVIIPINEHMHWYLALIYEPEHVLQPRGTLRTATLTGTEETATEEMSKARSISPDTPRGSEAEVEENLTTLTKACSISIDEDAVTASSTTRSVEMDVDPDITAPMITEPPSPTLSYTDAVEPMQEPSTSHPSRASSPMSISPEIGEVPLPPTEPISINEIHDEEQDDLNIISNAPSEAGPPEIFPQRFYGAKSSKNKGRQKKGANAKRGRPSDVPVIIPHPQPNTTYIFSLDSLGTTHTYALTQLAKYLVLEAKEKKEIEADVKSIVKRQAIVPTQPNYCDCGLYLLHLAQTFVSDPKLYLEKCCVTDRLATNTQRQKDWHDHKVPEMRQSLLNEIQHLSGEWRKVKLEKEKAEKANDAPKNGTDDGETSDSDISFVGVTIASKPKSKARKRLSDTELRVNPPRRGDGPAARIR